MDARKKIRSVKLTLLFLLQSFCSAAQTEVIDTIVVYNEQAVILSDGTWRYLMPPSFMRVKNTYLTRMFESRWHTNKAHAKGENPATFQDYLEIDLVTRIESYWHMPCKKVAVSSEFKQRGDRFHYGIDLAIKVGKPIYSCFDGVVRYAQYNAGGYGNLIVIRHSNGLETYYAHLNEVSVKTGDTVYAGTIIGKSGNTGKSSGPHLHFEVRFNGYAFNPEYFIDFEEGQLKTTIVRLTADLFKSSSRGSHSIKNYYDDEIDHGHTFYDEEPEINTLELAQYKETDLKAEEIPSSTASSKIQLRNYRDQQLVNSGTVTVNFLKKAIIAGKTYHQYQSTTLQISVDKENATIKISSSEVGKAITIPIANQKIFDVRVTKKKVLLLLYADTTIEL